MKLSASERLQRFYDCFHNDDHVAVVMFADPDAMASAMAVKRLLWRRVAAVTLVHINEIKRPDNLAMIRLLGLKMLMVERIEQNRYSRLVMVDSQPNHQDVFSELKPDVIIDHHPDTGAKVVYADIRPKYGATASIMTEYIRAARIKPSAKLATGLLHAIKTDTSNFERKSLMEDVRAFQFLFRHANANMAWKMEHAELKISFLRYFKIALNEMRLRRRKIFVNLGKVTNPDVCVIIADFFMKTDSVLWSVVTGIYDNRLVVIFRNDGLRKNAGRVAHKSFGHLGQAGGHKSMARAEIPIAKIKGKVDLTNNRTVLSWVIAAVEKTAWK